MYRLAQMLGLWGGPLWVVGTGKGFLLIHIFLDS